ncbi:CotH kinase family protein [Butyrivibrio sp. INlla16]|uniref:CotH kinase family protein n=1 Tax=Butyrivibrio sp. INlla16 TaxID=1520807 RepID=UPI0008922016|nr:CotH kinase family protein [Butyrivibrio sp. INlla16]SDB28272.1 CotH protein [Butyrivibrio sp. INlla16]
MPIIRNFLDEIISYFVAHNFVLNYDSYTGTMLHNYYLYENDGGLSMLPWDYNLSFGAFSGGGKEGETDATSLINTGIDSPLSGTAEDARPMWSWIVSNEEYPEKYHEASARWKIVHYN